MTTLIVLALLVWVQPSRALVVDVERADLNRALKIARSPASDALRAQFHAAYTFPIRHDPVEYAAVSSIEVVTEFRRVTLLAAAHMRLNDLWGRGDLRDVQDELNPWHGTTTIVAHVDILPTMTFIAGVPPIDIVVEGMAANEAMLLRHGIYSSSSPGDGGGLVGADIEQKLDSRSLGQRARQVCVVWNQRSLGCARIDFAQIE